MTDEATVLFWEGHGYPTHFTDEYEDPSEFPEPDSTLTVEDNEAVIFRDNPHHHHHYGIHVEETLHDDVPVTVNIYTNESVHNRGFEEGNSPAHIDRSYWNGPIERGLTFRKEQDDPFGCEIWGRILVHVEVEVVG